MSELIIVVYKSQDSAFVAGESLAVMQQEAGTEPEDIVVVTRSAAGRVSVNQSIDLVTSRPLGGGAWGTLIGMLFLDARSAKSSKTGLAAQFREAGLDATFMKDVSFALKKSGAAVGMRVRLLGGERVAKRVGLLKGSGKLFRTQLTAEAEERLTDMLEQIPPNVLAQAENHGGLE